MTQSQIRSARQRMSAEAFEAWVQHPQRQERQYELIAGEVYEVVSNNEASDIASVISGFLFIYLRQNRIGRLTTTDGGYVVNGERYIPDVSYTSFATRPKPTRDAYYPKAPDLAVEVISNASNNAEQTALRLKLSNYLAANVLVWVVNLDEPSIEVHQAGHAPRLLTSDDTLTGGALLPGFSVPVAEVFA